MLVFYEHAEDIYEHDGHIFTSCRISESLGSHLIGHDERSYNDPDRPISIGLVSFSVLTGFGVF